MYDIYTYSQSSFQSSQQGAIQQTKKQKEKKMTEIKGFIQCEYKGMHKLQKQSQQDSTVQNIHLYVWTVNVI